MAAIMAIEVVYLSKHVVMIRIIGLQNVWYEAVFALVLALLVPLSSPIGSTKPE